MDIALSCYKTKKTQWNKISHWVYKPANMLLQNKLLHKGECLCRRVATRVESVQVDT